jgi:hypothetical protein
MRSDAEENDILSLDQLFPVGSRALLTGTGKQFIERIGVEAVFKLCGRF